MSERIICPYIAHMIGEYCVFVDRTCNNDCLDIKEEKNMGNGNKEFVRQIREAGESLIKNAESIVGSETYLSGLKINIECFTGEMIEPLEITVTKSFYPEKYIERIG